MRKKRTVQLILTLFLIGTVVGSVHSAHISYKSLAEIYDDIPLGEVEIDIKQILPPEGLEPREDRLGEIRVWTYIDDTELILQLIPITQNITDFRGFTVEVQTSLDMIFVIDLTSSMSQYLGKIKEQLKELVLLLSTTRNAPLKFGVVGFKDCPTKTIQLPLTNNYAEVRTVIDSLTTENGREKPRSHHLGLQAALDDFKTNSALTNDRVIIFISDSEAEFDDESSFKKAKAVADEIAEHGIRINAVLCGDDHHQEDEQLKCYANVTGGQYIGPPRAQNRIISVSTSHPTWKVLLTPITPLDSLHLRFNSSRPSQKQGYYTFYVSFCANPIRWHDSFSFKLMANLEK